jgi:hypothetical protein
MATTYPLVQASPRLQSQRFAPNNRSFTCLLKEIDEEEEKNLVGSLPGGSKVTRDPNARIPDRLENDIEKKSRNMN